MATVEHAPGKSTSVWFTAEEYEHLQAAADVAGVAANAIVRTALRRLLGLPRISSSRVERILDDLATGD